MPGIRTLCVLLVLCAVSACSNEEPSGDSGELSDPADGTARCAEERTAVGSQEEVVAELGFSAADVLAFSEGQRETMLEWLPTQFVEYQPGSGNVPMLLSVGYERGSIEFIDATLRAVDGNVSDVDIECDDALSIEVEVALETAEGALRERFTAELRANAATAAQIVHEVELDSLVGTFEITEIEGFGFADGGSAELS